MTHLYDYSWTHPDPKLMASVPGCLGVIRYLSGGGSKDITRQEADELHAAGLAVSLVWETGGSREEQGYGAGYADALAANAQADALGVPGGIVIWYADDNNEGDPSQEYDYFSGVLAACATRPIIQWRPAGQYGNGLIAQSAIDRGDYGWRVETWRAGDSLDPHMVQLANTHQPEIPNTDPGAYDTNIVLHDFPMWGPSGTTNTGDDMAFGDDEKAALYITKEALLGGNFVKVEDSVVARLDRVEGWISGGGSLPSLEDRVVKRITDALALVVQTPDKEKLAAQVQNAISIAKVGTKATRTALGQVAVNIIRLAR